jgi:hypothetical protein
MLKAFQTKLSMDISKKPSGLTDPKGENISKLPPVIANLKLFVDKSDVANELKSVTFDNIRANFEKQVHDILKSEYDSPSKKLSYNIDWQDIHNNQAFAKDMYTSNPYLYIIILDIYMTFTDIKKKE